MTVSLYDATVPVYLQVLRSIRSLTEAAEAHCTSQRINPVEMLNAHFGSDMQPLAWQIKWVNTHSRGAVEAIRSGTFLPDWDPPAQEFTDLRAQIDDTIGVLQALDRSEVEGLAGRDVVVVIGEMRLEFLAEDFLLSFAMLHFFFHAVTAYVLLRDAGVPIGKADYIGMPRLKMPVSA